MENPRHHGPITCLCLDRKRAWVICGTSSGVLSLWDLRFGILIKSWKVSAASHGRSAKVYQCAVHPTKGKGRWITVAVESPKTHGGTDPSHAAPLVEVWDIEKTLLVETFTTRTGSGTFAPLSEPQETTGEEAETSPAAAIAALVRARQEGSAPPDFVARRRSSTPVAPAPSIVTLGAPSPDVHALVLGTEFGGHGTLYRSPMAEHDDGASVRAGRGFMLCGSEDRRIRLWDLGKTERSVVLSGPEGESERPTYRYVTECLSCHRPPKTDQPVLQHHTSERWISVNTCRDLGSRAVGWSK